jgi:hypothetical protein
MNIVILDSDGVVVDCCSKFRLLVPFGVLGKHASAVFSLHKSHHQIVPEPDKKASLFSLIRLEQKLKVRSGLVFTVKEIEITDNFIVVYLKQHFKSRFKFDLLLDVSDYGLITDCIIKRTRRRTKKYKTRCSTLLENDLDKVDRVFAGNYLLGKPLLMFIHGDDVLYLLSELKMMKQGKIACVCIRILNIELMKRQSFIKPLTEFDDDFVHLNHTENAKYVWADVVISRFDNQIQLAITKKSRNIWMRTLLWMIKINANILKLLLTLIAMLVPKQTRFKFVMDWIASFCEYWTTD